MDKKEITSTCLNGELRVGDIVISTGKLGDYASYLMGEVIEIIKRDTPLHEEETGNDTDNIHVNFYEAGLVEGHEGGYSDLRKAQIVSRFRDLFNDSRTFDECGIDDVIMSPNELIKVTDELFSADDIRMFLQSETGAVDICNKVITILNKTGGIING